MVAPRVVPQRPGAPGRARAGAAAASRGAAEEREQPDEAAPQEELEDAEAAEAAEGDEAAEEAAEAAEAPEAARPARDENQEAREDDLALEEVPEDMRESVEGNLQLKRILSSSELDGAGAAKRRRTEEGGGGRALGGAKAEVLAKWRLEGDPATTYVLEGADMEDVEAVLRSNWHPNRFAENNSCGEQISDRLVRARESKFPPGGALDAVAAFGHRWKLGAEERKALAELCHKDLRHVVAHYDGTQPLAELAEEAGMSLPEEEDRTTADAAPDKPGPLTLGRFHRLELIDPVADALVLGDANLTFSVLLAEHREDLGHVGRIVATTFETIETLRERYAEIDSTVTQLEDQNAEVLHNVDCTRLAVDPRFKDMAGKFGAVYYNFPHAGVIKGFFDSHPFVRWRHENLMQLFFRALRGFVKPGGSVKVSSNSQATGVRYSDILSAAALSEFVHVETMPFLEWRLRGYRRSYGDRRDANRRPEDGEGYKSQRAHSDMVYCFRYEPSGGAPPKPRLRRPPVKRDLLDSNEGWFKGLHPEARRRRIEEIFQLFLSFVEGVHVG